jgi:hypothetical protein
MPTSTRHRSLTRPLHRRTTTSGTLARWSSRSLGMKEYRTRRIDFYFYVIEPHEEQAVEPSREDAFGWHDCC